MAQSTLPRTGNGTKMILMLIVKAEPESWKTKPLLLHFLEKNGASVVFQVTGDAKTALKKLEPLRIYEITVAGKCVKRVDGMATFGVPVTLTAFMQFEPKHSLAKLTEVWTVNYQFNFSSWDQLNQVEDKGCVDLLGEVVDIPVLDVGSKIKKLLVDLANGEFVQRIEFLGDHASLVLKKGAKVAISGVRVNAYKGTRTLQTNWLSYIEIDYKVAATDKKRLLPPNPHPEGPRKKAVRLNFSTLLSCADVVSLIERITNDVEALSASEEKPQQLNQYEADFCVRGTFAKLTKDFFVNDAPIKETKKGEVLSLTTELEDKFAKKIIVQVWSQAVSDLFNVTMENMRTLWEKGVDHKDEQDKILQGFNDKLKGEFNCVCKAIPRTYGGSEGKDNVVVNINVNNIEKVEQE